MKLQSSNVEFHVQCACVVMKENRMKEERVTERVHEISEANVSLIITQFMYSQVTTSYWYE